MGKFQKYAKSVLVGRVRPRQTGDVAQIILFAENEF